MVRGDQLSGRREDAPVQIPNFVPEKTWALYVCPGEASNEESVQGYRMRCRKEVTYYLSNNSWTTGAEGNGQASVWGPELRGARARERRRSALLRLHSASEKSNAMKLK
jgi:hypothetical protein